MHIQVPSICLILSATSLCCTVMSIHAERYRSVVDLQCSQCRPQIWTNMTRGGKRGLSLNLPVIRQVRVPPVNRDQVSRRTDRRLETTLNFFPEALSNQSSGGSPSSRNVIGRTDGHSLVPIYRAETPHARDTERVAVVQVVGHVRVVLDSCPRRGKTNPTQQTSDATQHPGRPAKPGPPRHAVWGGRRLGDAPFTGDY